MTRSIKVLHLIEGLGSGGAERLLYTNLKYFPERMVESEVMTVLSGPNYWKQPIEKLGVKVRSLERSSTRDLIRGIFRLRSYLRKHRPDVVHTHLFAANIIGRVAGRLAGIPVVSSIHNPEYEGAAIRSVSRLGKLKIAAARTLDAVTARIACNRMLAVSKFVAQSASEKLAFPAEAIDVIYNPVSTLLDGSNETRNRIRRELALPEDGRLLLSVARLSPQKGFIDAVRAMSRLVKNDPKLSLCSVGVQNNSEYKRQILDEIDRAGLDHHVRLLGERSDIHDLLAACDVFVFPSRFEGLGIALAEAMAAGCACVVSDIRPFDEFVTDGVNAILVTPGDADALADAIMDLLRDEEKRIRIGAGARRTANDLFRPEPAAKKLAELYFAVVGN